MDTPFWGTFGQPARARGVVLGSLHAPGRSLSPLELFGAACARARGRAQAAQNNSNGERLRPNAAFYHWSCFGQCVGPQMMDNSGLTARPM